MFTTNLKLQESVGAYVTVLGDIRTRGKLKRARQWLSECVTEHTCPRPITAAVPLPQRLVQVEGGPEDPVRLIETRGDEYPYVCLSHRWGDPTHKQLKTTTRTVESHLNKIEWVDLPATFRDAVTVCRSMDVKYLWIDSLCILQSFAEITSDELEVTRQDFAKENSTMARTYQNSHFTISADLSDHMDSGFFSRDPVDEYNKDIITDDGSVASVYIRKPLKHYSEEIPCLETRGWTLQESLLPPRVLHFGEFDIAWRCKTRINCECGHLDRSEALKNSWHRFHDMEELARPPPNDSEGSREWWERLVDVYSRRHLTNPADKLPALSGLAQERKKVRGGVYLAGLWLDSLMYDLCWYRVKNDEVTPGDLGHRPPCYRAPSWSWAAVDNHSGCSWYMLGMVFPYSMPKQACVILDVSCEPATTDPTGEVRSGFLDVKTSLATAEIYQYPGEQVFWGIRKLDRPLRLNAFMPDCVLEDDDLNLGDQVFCAPIVGVKSPSDVTYDCLVLKQIDGRIYQRVAFCTIVIKRTDLQSHDEDNTESDPKAFTWPGSVQVQIRIV
ncbi:uncharacterized protein FSUBG_11400 [Fusarium subglutinans]|uniref:Heterokaryon incompatibility domain-containing protein n=1 Tax=Gibberella subglutinans TaxID=42677 RepID=A0A8H5P2R6_GIBSU|nr:uncharacterized protein FSUBG_11400 [Fusarium subglutinans]KAF5588741.1 hypothetical protein FSUBG_11400 [Fusarium subglutinans]